jgi:hypothetical protein
VVQVVGHEREAVNEATRRIHRSLMPDRSMKRA